MINKRNIYYDLIRITACFLVIVNHSIWMFKSYDKIPLGTWIASDIIFFICKMAVPMFIILSGSLLLGKQERYRDIALNRILKTISILIVWSLIYKIYYNRGFLSISELIIFLKNLIKNPISTHFWYIYMLIGLYIMTPFIRKMVKNFTEKDYIVFISIWIVLATIVPFLRIFKPLQYSQYFTVELFTGYIGYYVAGYYLDKLKLNKKLFKIALSLFFAGLSIATVTTYLLTKAKGTTVMSLDNVRMFPIMMMSLSIFLIIKYIGNNINEILNKPKVKKIIVNISSNTFGIYLVHIIINNELTKSSIYTMIFHKGLNPILGLVIYDLLVFSVSYIIIEVIRRVPIIKKIA